MAYNRDYHREYYRQYAQDRRDEAVALLGGCCAVCGTTETLEIDHIDPSAKSFTLTQGWSKKRETWLAELAKCQLLCKKHHDEKTLRDAGRVSAKETHGTLSAYRHCGPPKCDDCKRAKREFARSNPSPSRQARSRKAG